MNRFVQRKNDYENALKRLKEALSHLYDDGTSREIYNDIKGRFVKEFEKLENKFNEVNIEL